MLSAGGIATLETAMRFPVRLLESGPAAGALAAAHYGAAAGVSDLLSFDMGGTTAKFCGDRRRRAADGERVRGRPPATASRRAPACRSRSPVIEMIEIGAGGGSIARVDAPGPAAGRPRLRGRRSRAGLLRPRRHRADRHRRRSGARLPRPGVLPRRRDGARPGGRRAQAIADRVADPLGLTIEEAAWGIHQIVNETWPTPRACTSLERGSDPRGLPVFAFGGAGPVHGYRVAARARRTDADRAVRRRRDVDASASWPRRWRSTSCARGRRRSTTLDWDRVEALLAEMEREGAPAGVVRRRARPDHARRGRPTCATPARATRSAWSGPRSARRTPVAARRVRGGVRAALRPARPRGRRRWRRSPGACSRRARDPSVRAGRCAGESRRRGAARASGRPTSRARRADRDPGLRPLPARARRALRGPGDRRGARVDARSSAPAATASSTTAGTSW